MVGGDEGVGEAERNQAAMLRARLQLAFRFQNGHAGAFAADQGAGHVEAVFRQQLIQVVAGDATRNVGEAGAHERRIGVAQAAQPRVDLAAPAAGGNDGGQLILRCGTDAHARAVVEQDVQRFDVVYRFAAHQGVHAAGVVADHAAQRAAAVGGWIGGKGQLVLLGPVAQRIENNPRLDPGAAGGSVERDHRMHVFREVEHHGDVAGLPRNAGAAAAREYGGSEFAAGRNCGDDVRLVAWQHQADRHLAVVRGVSRIERPRRSIETNFAADSAAQTSFQIARRGKCFVRVPGWSLRCVLENWKRLSKRHG